MICLRQVLCDIHLKGNNPDQVASNQLQGKGCMFFNIKELSLPVYSAAKMQIALSEMLHFTVTKHNFDGVTH